MCSKLLGSQRQDNNNKQLIFINIVFDFYLGLVRKVIKLVAQSGLQANIRKPTKPSQSAWRHDYGYLTCHSVWSQQSYTFRSSIFL